MVIVKLMKQMSDLSDVPAGCMCEFFRVDIDKVAIEDFPERQQTSFAAKKLLPGEFAIIWFVRPMLYHSPIQTLLTACVHETLKSLSSYLVILVKSSQFKKSICIFTV